MLINLFKRFQNQMNQKQQKQQRLGMLVNRFCMTVMMKCLTKENSKAVEREQGC